MGMFAGAAAIGKPGAGSGAADGHKPGSGKLRRQRALQRPSPNPPASPKGRKCHEKAGKESKCGGFWNCCYWHILKTCFGKWRSEDFRRISVTALSERNRKRALRNSAQLDVEQIATGEIARVERIYVDVKAGDVHTQHSQFGSRPICEAVRVVGFIADA